MDTVKYILTGGTNCIEKSTSLASELNKDTTLQGPQKYY